MQSVDFPTQQYEAVKIFPSKYLDFFVNEQPSVSQVEAYFLSPFFFFPRNLSPVHLAQKYFYINPIIFSFVSEVGSHQTGFQPANSLAQVFGLERKDCR